MSANCFSSGGFRPRDPLLGLHRWTALGDFCPPDLLAIAPKRNFWRRHYAPYDALGPVPLLDKETSPPQGSDVRPRVRLHGPCPNEDTPLSAYPCELGDLCCLYDSATCTLCVFSLNLPVAFLKINPTFWCTRILVCL